MTTVLTELSNMFTSVSLIQDQVTQFITHQNTKNIIFKNSCFRNQEAIIHVMFELKNMMMK